VAPRAALARALRHRDERRQPRAAPGHMRAGMGHRGERVALGRRRDRVERDVKRGSVRGLERRQVARQRRRTHVHRPARGRAGKQPPEREGNERERDRAQRVLESHTAFSG